MSDRIGEQSGMKRALVAIGVVYVVVEVLARRFEAQGWTGISTLDVASAVLDAALVVVLALGVLLAGRLGLERWARSMRRWHREQAQQEGSPWDEEAEVIGVRSWRHGDRELPRRPAPPPPSSPAAAPAPAPSSGFTYVGPTYTRDAPVAPRFREDLGPLL